MKITKLISLEFPLFLFYAVSRIETPPFIHNKPLFGGAIQIATFARRSQLAADVLFALRNCANQQPAISIRSHTMDPEINRPAREWVRQVIRQHLYTQVKVRTNIS